MAGRGERKRPSFRGLCPALTVQPVFLTASASIAKSSCLVNSRVGVATVLDLDVLDLDILAFDTFFDTTLSTGRPQAAASFGLRIGTETIFGLAVGGL